MAATRKLHAADQKLRAARSALLLCEVDFRRQRQEYLDALAYVTAHARDDAGVPRDIQLPASKFIDEDDK